MDALSAKSAANGLSGDIFNSGAITVNSGMSSAERAVLFGLGLYLLYVVWG